MEFLTHSLFAADTYLFVQLYLDFSLCKKLCIIHTETKLGIKSETFKRPYSGTE